MDFYAWDWIRDALWHFKMALAETWCIVRCLWWAALSFVEWMCAVMKGENDETMGI